TGKTAEIKCSGQDVPIGFSSNGEAVVCADADGGGSLVTKDGNGESIRLAPQAKKLTTATFSATGSVMATASINQNVYVWRQEQGGSAGSGGPRAANATPAGDTERAYG